MNELIRRQAAIDALNGEFTVTGRKNAETIRDYINGVDKRLRELPSAVRHGRWVLITKDGIVPAEFLCSVCGRKISHSGVKDMVSIHYPYCHCGAKMDEVEE